MSNPLGVTRSPSTRAGGARVGGEWEISVWRKSVSVGCLAMWGLWAGAVALILLGWGVGEGSVGQLGIAASAAAAALTVMRDNHRTRRQIYATAKRANDVHPSGASGDKIRYLVQPDDYV